MSQCAAVGSLFQEWGCKDCPALYPSSTLGLLMACDTHCSSEDGLPPTLAPIKEWPQLLMWIFGLTQRAVGALSFFWLFSTSPIVVLGEAQKASPAGSLPRVFHLAPHPSKDTGPCFPLYYPLSLISCGLNSHPSKPLLPPSLTQSQPLGRFLGCL